MGSSIHMDLLDYGFICSLQVAILCGHHKVSGEISGFDLSQVGKCHDICCFHPNCTAANSISL